MKNYTKSQIVSMLTGTISAVSLLITALGVHFHWSFTTDVTFVAGVLSQFVNAMFAVLTGSKGGNSTTTSDTTSDTTTDSTPAQ